MEKRAAAATKNYFPIYIKVSLMKPENFGFGEKGLNRIPQKIENAHRCLSTLSN